jgi:predicted secreted protein
VLSTAREGADAAAVQAQLRQALDAALAEARKAARPGQVEVSTGAFSLYPRYANPVPGSSGAASRSIAGWQGSTELVIQGRDSAAIAQLAGRIPTLTIARVGFTLSREAREAVEGDVSAQAIARFRKQADAVTRQFGFHDYTVREVTVSGNDAPPGGPVPVMRVQGMRASAEDALPVEAGKALVTATVSGSVQMK